MKSERLQKLLDDALAGNPDDIARDCREFLRLFKARRIGTEPAKRQNFTRKQVEKAWLRQGGKCGRCGEFVEKNEAQAGDHDTPVVMGGLTKMSNCVMMHPRCNGAKSGRDLMSDVKRTGQTALERIKLTKLEEQP